MTNHSEISENCHRTPLKVPKHIFIRVTFLQRMAFLWGKSRGNSSEKSENVGEILKQCCPLVAFPWNISPERPPRSALRVRGGRGRGRGGGEGGRGRGGGFSGSENKTKYKTHKQTFRGIVPGFSGDFGYVFFSPIRNDPQNHRNWETNFYTPPVLGGAALFPFSALAVYKNPVP